MNILKKINKLIGKYESLDSYGIESIIDHELAVLKTLKELINNIGDNPNVNIFILEKLESLELQFNDIRRG